MATLRDYLQIEYKVKKGEQLSDVDQPSLFTKETMAGSCLKVPQQNNYSDCGIYVLQYAESFMKVTEAGIFLSFFIYLFLHVLYFLPLCQRIISLGIIGNRYFYTVCLRLKLRLIHLSIVHELQELLNCFPKK